MDKIIIFIHYFVVVENVILRRRVTNREFAERIVNSLVTTTGYTVIYDDRDAGSLRVSETMRICS